MSFDEAFNDQIYSDLEQAQENLALVTHEAVLLRRKHDILVENAVDDLEYVYESMREHGYNVKKVT